MITRLNVASIYVLDKDEALDFYVNKLGLEKGNDVRQGDYRWLTIRVPGQPARRSRSSSRARRSMTKPPRHRSGS
jgi:catechol 2,3-dioxygenase-like lactoylglutathione lyase family enzyme